jgi:hypothetical protein
MQGKRISLHLQLFPKVALSDDACILVGAA